MLHHLTAPAPSPHQLATLHPVDARSDTLLRLEQRQGVFRLNIKVLFYTFFFRFFSNCLISAAMSSMSQIMTKPL